MQLLTACPCSPTSGRQLSSTIPQSLANSAEPLKSPALYFPNHFTTAFANSDCGARSVSTSDVVHERPGATQRKLEALEYPQLQNATASNTSGATTPCDNAFMMNTGIWSEEEHDQFLTAIKQFPNGPWTSIAEAIGTRSVRQVQTHTQKYYEKIVRRMRGARKERKTWARLEHRIEDDILEFCSIMHGSRSIRSAAGAAAAVKQSRSPATSTSASPNHDVPMDGVKMKQEEFDEIDLAGSDSNDDDDTLDQLPSLEESLDFFIASLERDSDFLR